MCDNTAVGIIKQLVLKDIRYMFRVKSAFFSPIVFSLITSFVISFSVPQDVLKTHAFPIMWIVFIFSSVFPAVELMRYEGEGGVLEGILSSPLKKEFIFISKFLSTFFVFLITGISLFFIFFFFANFSPSFHTLLSFFLASLGVSSISVLFASFYMKDTLRIPIYVILFPLYIPVVISAVEISQGNLSAFKIILGFDIVNFFLSFALFDVYFD